jgi:hypothetical protein
LEPENVMIRVVTAEQEEPERTNEGVRRLVVQLAEASGSVRVVVQLSPLWPEGGASRAVEVRALADW